MRFAYKPLHTAADTPIDPLEIRLLELLPLRYGEKIQCQLRHTSLSDASLQYETLSYCWGDPHKTMDVEMNCSIVSVTKNLYHALHGLRQDTESRTLWVDALCINQANNHEKGEQVQLMRQIYQRCQRVLVWLGESHKDSKRAIRLVKILSRVAKKYPDIPRLQKYSAQIAQEYGIPSLLDWSHACLMEVTKLPWFQRAWIVQEATLPPTARLHWGGDANEIVDWVDLLGAVDVGQKLCLPFIAHPRFFAMQSIIVIRDTYKRGEFRPFLDTLLAHHQAHATVPRDKIFAFLGLLGPDEADALKIEVKYDGPFTPLLVNVAQQIASHERSLRILSVKSFLPPSDLPDVPSWVPDWSAPQRGPPLLLANISLVNSSLLKDMLEPFDAAKGSTHTADAPVPSGVLRVEGFVVDKIDQIGVVFPGYRLPSTWLALLNSFRVYARALQVIPKWEDMAMENGGTTYVTGEHMHEAFWRTLCCNLIFQSDSVANIRQEIVSVIEGHRKYASAFRTPLLGPVYLLVLVSWVLIKMLVLRSPLPTILHNRCGPLADRKFIRTRLGYIGVASGKDTQVGDGVALLKGSTVPLIVRRSDTDTWALVGDAYVHGLMRGEAFDEGKCKTMDLH